MRELLVRSETTPEGVLRFSLELNIDMAEMREWPAPCVTAFFDGIARAQEAVAYARDSIIEKRRAVSPTEHAAPTVEDA